MGGSHPDAPVVGIPRAMLYFSYQPLWKTFLSQLGMAVRVSNPTRPTDRQNAQILTESDLCLPIKVFLLHVSWLKDKVNWLLLPRVISLSPDAYTCPKIIGLTDIVRNVFPKLPGILDPTINAKLKNPLGFAEACSFVGHRFVRDPTQIQEAWRKAEKIQADFEDSLQKVPLDTAMKSWDPEFGRFEKKKLIPVRNRVAIIARPYVIFDPALSHDLLTLLHQYGVEVVTAEGIPSDVKEEQNARLPKKVYWHLGKSLVGAAMVYANDSNVDGMINLSIFGCGQDAFTSALIEQYVKHHSEKPLLNLVLDEHTDSSALRTRIEAFLDVVDERKKKRPSFPCSKIGEAIQRNLPRKGHQIHLTVPHMGHLHLGFEKVFRDLGVQITMPPRQNEKALKLGTRHSPEGACLPFKLNLGNMIQALENGVTDILVAGGFGPCRYGYYSVVQEQILRDLGYEFRIGRTDDPDSLRNMLATIKAITGFSSKWDAYGVFFFILYRLAAVDRALRQAHWYRAREMERGATDRALQQSFSIIEETRSFRELWRAKKKIRSLFHSIPIQRKKPVLRVGVVGEIFMVLDDFANMHVEERLGKLGVEVNRGVWLSDWLNDRFRFKPLRRNQTKWSLRQACNYLRYSCGGESAQSIGKSIHFARRGIHGIVHIMPFTCMPELVAQTILSRVGGNFDIPILPLIFDEHTASGAVQTRLEAFVDLLKLKLPFKSKMDSKT